MKKMMISAVAFATMVLGAGSLAEAGPYGTAGCGLGSIVFGNSPGIVQIFAATTNGTFATQTFGITSGTSNCVDGGGGGPTAAAFIQTNRVALSKEISRGNGETIANLSTLSGCADANAVGAELQKKELQGDLPGRHGVGHAGLELGHHRAALGQVAQLHEADLVAPCALRAW
jgi:hypothetical protein